MIWVVSGQGIHLVILAAAGSTLNHWPFPASHLQEGYAYLLMHPGTPCVFYDHYFEDSPVGEAVRKLLKVRRSNGIPSRSKVRLCQSGLRGAH